MPRLLHLLLTISNSLIPSINGSVYVYLLFRILLQLLKHSLRQSQTVKLSNIVINRLCVLLNQHTARTNRGMIPWHNLLQLSYRSTSIIYARRVITNNPRQHLNLRTLILRAVGLRLLHFVQQFLLTALFVRSRSIRLLSLRVLLLCLRCTIAHKKPSAKRSNCR